MKAILASKINSTPTLTFSSPSTNNIPVTSGLTKINALPFSILEKIQNYLTQKENAQITHLVSRLWRSLRRTDGCLHLSDSTINDIGLKQLVDQYKGRPISSLNISGCRKLSRACTASLTTLTSLTDLNLGYMYRNCQEALSDLPINKLTFASDKYQGVGGLGSILDLDSLQSKYLLLKELNYTCEDIYECSIGTLFCLHLQSLDLTILNASNITNEHLEGISQLPLKSLNLNNCPLITDSGIKSIATQLIESLSISNSQISVMSFYWISALPLKSLSLENCKGFSEFCFWRLRELSLTSLYIDDCNFSDYSLQCLKPTLTRLHLTSPKNFSDDDGLKMLCRFPLTDLYLHSCPEITDAGIQYLMKLPLKYLDIINCLNVTKAPSFSDPSCTITYKNPQKIHTNSDSCIIS
jgi:Leucine Rich repeat